MDKKKFFDFLFLFMIICLIAFMIFVVQFMLNNGGKCLKDPITFFEDLNEGAECKCVKNGVTWPNTVEVTRTGETKTYADINFSNIEVIKLNESI